MSAVSNLTGYGLDGPRFEPSSFTFSSLIILFMFMSLFYFYLPPISFLFVSLLVQPYTKTSEHLISVVYGQAM